MISFCTSIIIWVTWQNPGCNLTYIVTGLPFHTQRDCNTFSCFKLQKPHSSAESYYPAGLEFILLVQAHHVVVFEIKQKSDSVSTYSLAKLSKCNVMHTCIPYLFLKTKMSLPSLLTVELPAQLSITLPSAFKVTGTLPSWLLLSNSICKKKQLLNLHTSTGKEPTCGTAEPA